MPNLKRPPKPSIAALRGLKMMAEKYSSLPEACLLPEEQAAVKWIRDLAEHRAKRAYYANGVVVRGKR